MEVFEAIKKRRSIRKYKPDKIPEKDLKEILEAARLAPSAHNWQYWKFILVRDPDKIKLLAEITQPFLSEAACAIVALAKGDPSVNLIRARAKEKKFTLDMAYSYLINLFKRDVMIAIQNMVIAAQGLGYGTCWIGTMVEEEVKKLLGIPLEWNVVDLISVGVPDESPEPKSRKPFSEIFFDEEYGKSLIF
ncbi:nitroreductase family protein [Thermoproteota archaeon]